MNKLTKIIGLLIAIAFLVGLATTLTRSMMIGFLDVMPVYILMGIAIFMMIYEAFFDKKNALTFAKRSRFSLGNNGFEALAEANRSTSPFLRESIVGAF